MAQRGGDRRFRIRILPSVLLTAAILLLPAMLYAWGRQADSFEVRQIKVTGTKRVPRKEVATLLRRDYLGTNLFRVTQADVLATLDKLPYVAGVVVDRRFPTTLHVEVIEYRPAAYVLSRDHWYVVSDSGHVVDKLPATEATMDGETGAEDTTAAGSGEAALGDGVSTADGAATTSETTGASATPAPGASGSPVAEETASLGDGATVGGVANDAGTDTTDAVDAVGQDASSQATDPAAVAAALSRGPHGVKLQLPRIASSQKLKPGAQVRDEDLRTALAVVAGLPGSLRRRVNVVDVQPGGQVTLSLDGSLTVEMGDTTRLLAKVLSLRAVLRAYEVRGKSATFVDVSIPDRPLARPRLIS
jgi:hypothetical protein